MGITQFCVLNGSGSAPYTSVMPNTKQKSSNRSTFFVFIALFVLLGGAKLIQLKQHSSSPTPSPVAQVKRQPFDFGNQTIMLDDQQLVLVNDWYRNGDQSATVTYRTGSPSGLKFATILANQPGGSGTFFYVVGGSLVDGQEKYSTPLLLGDRVKIESVEVQDDGIVYVKYLDHVANSPMTTMPTKKVTKKFAFQDDGNLIDVLK